MPERPPTDPLAALRAALLLAMGLTTCAPQTPARPPQPAAPPPPTIVPTRISFDLPPPPYVTYAAPRPGEKGLVKSSDGVWHRASPERCPTRISTPACERKYDFDCFTDDQCSAVPHGKCVETTDSDGAHFCVCEHSCATDSECPEGHVCTCGGDAFLTRRGQDFGRHKLEHGTCVPASCKQDSDCPSGLCARSARYDGCGDDIRFACRTDKDTCLTDKDCRKGYRGPNCAFDEYMSKTWTCVRQNCRPGRPLLVDGLARTVPTTDRDDWRAALPVPTDISQVSPHTSAPHRRVDLDLPVPTDISQASPPPSLDLSVLTDISQVPPDTSSHPVPPAISQAPPHPSLPPVPPDTSRAPPHPSLPPVPATARAALATHWTRIAALEHASVASFARFTLELLALGAPPDLLADAQRAALDEIEHARIAFALASRFAGRPIGPGPLDLTGALEPRDLTAFVASLVAEGCIGETLGAAELRTLARHADPTLAPVLEQIASDEQRHAALAWRTLRWLLAEHGDPVRTAALAALTAADPDLTYPSRDPRDLADRPVRTAADPDLTDHSRNPADPDPADPNLAVPDLAALADHPVTTPTAAWGLLDPAALATDHRRTFREVVRPVMHAALSSEHRSVRHPAPPSVASSPA